MTERTHDLIVVGAGPAGMSAALTAASIGLKTLLLDEQPRPGGQIYRNITAAAPSVAALLGADYRHGETLTDRLARSDADLRFGTAVWDVARDLTVTAQQDGQSFRVQAPQLIAATGAMERPSPIAGWTLPGVLNAGAAQIALKSASAIPCGRVVLAGAGPLLLLVACQLLDAGVSLGGIVETAPTANRWRALRHLPTALRAPAYLAKGVRMLQRVRRSGVPTFSAAASVRVEGNERAQALVFAAGGKEHRLDADVVLLHHGVVPNNQLSRLLRVDHDWDPVQLAWCPRVDAWGETSLAGFRIAGDGAAIAGALAAEPGGALAALGAARALGRLSAPACEARATPVRRALMRQLRIRPFLDALYRPPEWLSTPADETVVCRCEEVTAGRIREMARLGCQGPNQTKFFSRCGMGPCQGRMCGLAVTQILASELGKPPGQVGAYRIRAPLKPVSVSSIAASADTAAIEIFEVGENA
ncbi:FAD-binding protein [Verminephrobacter aporrectodeae subsp. tuberculatae]|uniref:FAD-dependent oxidoreductase n=1 Tax=Verminephrobacter aporrectodeae TaxID=1110389 RepID=UPI002237DCA8|nr:FAD-dependent oxidoreductase [Verminephrobacter aporrectodeae]MCW5223354.1 FAD-binding protein [Verminephrobacter aporrectodeae subsp. tuberculatae]MCW5288818.1 FAD-binding protein [Verminephrobacter aporrectodeae subsp. tuberculatae]